MQHRAIYWCLTFRVRVSSSSTACEDMWITDTLRWDILCRTFSTSCTLYGTYYCNCFLTIYCTVVDWTWAAKVSIGGRVVLCVETLPSPAAYLSVDLLLLQSLRSCLPGLVSAHRAHLAHPGYRNTIAKEEHAKVLYNMDDKHPWQYLITTLTFCHTAPLLSHLLI